WWRLPTERDHPQERMWNDGYERPWREDPERCADQAADLEAAGRAERGAPELQPRPEQGRRGGEGEAPDAWPERGRAGARAGAAGRRATPASSRAARRIAHAPAGAAPLRAERQPAGADR